MKRDTMQFKIISTYIGTQSIYETAKKLKTSIPLVSYHVKKFHKLDINPQIKNKFIDIANELIPIMEKHTAGLNYHQIEFFLKYLFYYIMNEYKP